MTTGPMHGATDDNEIVLDPDMEFVIDYLTQGISPEREAEFEQRFVDDEAFHDKVGPFMKVWNAPVNDRAVMAQYHPEIELPPVPATRAARPLRRTMRSFVPAGEYLFPATPFRIARYATAAALFLSALGGFWLKLAPPVIARLEMLARDYREVHARGIQRRTDFIAPGVPAVVNPATRSHPDAVEIAPPARGRSVPATAKPDSVKRVKPDSGKPAKVDSAKAAKVDSAKAAKVDSTKAAKVAKAESLNTARLDSARKPGYLGIPKRATVAPTGDDAEYSTVPLVKNITAYVRAGAHLTYQPMNALGRVFVMARLDGEAAIEITGPGVTAAGGTMSGIRLTTPAGLVLLAGAGRYAVRVAPDSSEVVVTVVEGLATLESLDRRVPVMQMKAGQFGRLPKTGAPTLADGKGFPAVPPPPKDPEDPR